MLWREIAGDGAHEALEVVVRVAAVTRSVTNRGMRFSWQPAQRRCMASRAGGVDGHASAISRVGSLSRHQPPIWPVP